MFEHMKNYKLLLNKISRWLKSNGKVSNITYHIYININNNNTIIIIDNYYDYNNNK